MNDVDCLRDGVRVRSIADLAQLLADLSQSCSDAGLHRPEVWPKCVACRSLWTAPRSRTWMRQAAGATAARSDDAGSGRLVTRAARRRDDASRLPAAGRTAEPRRESAD